MNLLQELQKRNIIDKATADALQAGALAAGKSVEDMVLEKKILEESALFALKSELLQIPLKHVDAQDVPLKVLELIPEDSAQYYKMVPLAKEGATLEIGLVHPEDARAQEALKFLSRQGRFSPQFTLITQSTFEGLMRQYRNLRKEVTKALEELEEEIQKEKEEGPRKGGPMEEELKRIVEEAPITKLVAVILRTAVEGKASDIHIEPTRENLRVRFRSLGQLHSSLMLPLKAHAAIVTRIKILSQMKIDETRIPQDGRFSAAIDEKSIDFRVATLPTTLGEKVAIRILDPEAVGKEFEELGLEGENLQKFKNALRKPFGLILVTGPTGSGKSTTLYTALKFLNKDEVNIVSLEDPVEYVVAGVNQSQVRPEIGYDFAQGLRQILRHDPDIVMVGEVRDEETAALVIHAALTGHIVLSTLHTNNALGVIPRLLDMGIEKYLLPPSLSVALAQRLVRQLCNECREKTELKKELRDMVLQEIAQASAAFQKRVSQFLKQGTGKPPELTVYKAVGCRKCSSTGFSGRIGIFEVLEMTEELEATILKEPSESLIGQEAKKQGMVTMLQDGILKMLDGVTTMEEVLRVTGEFGGTEERGGK